MREQLKPFILLCIVILMFVSKNFFEQKGRINEGNMVILLAIEPSDITLFRIFPRTGKPIGSSIEISPPEPIIDEFIQALTDIGTYLPNHDTVELREHTWSLEISTEEAEKIVPIHFYIPYQQGDIVVADMLGNDGYFQSRQLYQWYQKYSHRWLEPEDAPPTPTPQPDPPGGE